MKKIFIQDNEILKIAKIIKNFFPDKKFYIYQQKEKIIIKSPANINKLKLHELITTLKIEFQKEILIR